MHIPVLNLQCAFGLCEVNLPVQFCDVVMALPQVSYHYPCPDGVFAALAAHLCFSRAGQKVVWVPNAVYAPKQLGDLQLQVRLVGLKAVDTTTDAVSHRFCTRLDRHYTC